MAQLSDKAFVIYIDGASKGNPGPAGVGVVIQNADGKAILRISSSIGRATNNQAEYKALITALDHAAKLEADHVTVKTDSQLVAEHISGNYKVRNPRLVPLYREAMRLFSSFKTYSVDYIPRYLNMEADALAKASLKNRSS